MQSLNLYYLSRNVDKDILKLYEKSLSFRDDYIRIHEEEIEIIRMLVDIFQKNNVSDYYYDNWYYSYTIPQIGKEFDLLKIGIDRDCVVNIEIKSEEVPFEKIKKQLEKNKHYLEHISLNVYCFTVVKIDDMNLQIYMLDDEVRKSSIEELLRYIGKIKETCYEDIDFIFEPTQYLISPLNTPDKFIKKQYFLTNNQEEIKKKIIEDGYGLWGITGDAGTGKTLLLYDIARQLAEYNNVGVIHCGMINDGHRYLNNKLNNISIIAAKDINIPWIYKHRIIIVDEAHRLYKESVDLILNAYNNKRISKCIFAYDKKQVLSKKELNANNVKRFVEINGFNEKKLTTTIRTNKEISSFIRNMLILSDKPKGYVNYKNIDIIYANNFDESDRIIDFYKNRGYMFITYTPSQFYCNSIDHFSNNINSHEVIGQEFDSVLIVLDENFKYGFDGKLSAKIHPNPDYFFPRLFYQNITRARKKLCIVVINNKDLFKRLLQIKNATSDLEND